MTLLTMSSRKIVIKNTIKSILKLETNQSNTDKLFKLRKEMKSLNVRIKDLNKLETNNTETETNTDTDTESKLETETETKLDTDKDKSFEATEEEVEKVEEEDKDKVKEFPFHCETMEIKFKTLTNLDKIVKFLNQKNKKSLMEIIEKRKNTIGKHGRDLTINLNECLKSLSCNNQNVYSKFNGNFVRNVTRWTFKYVDKSGDKKINPDLNRVIRINNTVKNKSVVVSS